MAFSIEDQRTIDAINAQLKEHADRLTKLEGGTVAEAELTPDQRNVLERMAHLGVPQETIDQTRQKMLAGNAPTSTTAKSLTPAQEVQLEEMANYLDINQLNAARAKMLAGN